MICVYDIALAVSNIIFANEGGYGSVCCDDNGAMSIGKLQWHGERARELLLKICTSEPSAPEYLGVLYDELISDKSWKSRVLSDSEAEDVRALLLLDTSKKVQDKLALDNICTDIERGVGYGLSQCGALMYFADGANQYGRYSKLWKDATDKALLSGGTLDALHSAILSLATTRLERRKRTYEKIKECEISKYYLGEEIEEMDKCTDEITIHKVKRGDTLSAIALKYESEIDLIVEANKEKYKSITPDYIVCGWSLQIPKKEEKGELECALEYLCASGIVDNTIRASVGDATVIALWRAINHIKGGEK